MKKNVYIIGNHKEGFSVENQLKYYSVQMMLIEIGFNVTNPMERLYSEDFTKSEAKRKNLKDLMNSDAVYIMPDVELTKTNLELKLAIDFNLFTIISLLDCTSVIQSKRSRVKIGLKKT